MINNVESKECLVVLSDIHGQNDAFQSAVALARELDATIISNGDMIHGPEDLDVVRTLRDLGHKAIILPGNHEWAMFGYMYDARDEYKDLYQEYYFQFLERRRGQEIFGLGSKPSREDLRSIIQQEDFGNFFTDMKMFYQTEGVFVAHAAMHNAETAKRNMRFEALKAAQGIFDDSIKEIGQSGVVSRRLTDADDATLYVHGHYHQQGLSNNRNVPGSGRLNLARSGDGRLDALVLYPNGEREIVTVH